MKIKTTELLALITKAIKGASNNKMLPITTLLMIKAEDGTLTLETTDSVNYVYVSTTVDEHESMYAMVSADTFAKLIGKMTCEEVDIFTEHSVLFVSGNNGNNCYKLPMQLDEEGNVIVFPDKRPDLTVGRTTTVLVSDVIKARNACSVSLSNEISDIPISEYRFTDKVVATDATRLSCIALNVFDRDILLNKQFVDLICQSPEPELDVYILEEYNLIYVCSATYELVCTKVSDFSAYPKIDGLLADGLQFKGNCEIDVATMLSALDRMSLFTSPLSQNKVHISFLEEFINICEESASADNVEHIPYVSSNAFTPFECTVDIELLIAQLKAFTEDTATLHYANDTALKFVYKTMTQILCLSA